MTRYVGIDHHKHLIVGHVVDSDTFRYTSVDAATLDHIGRRRLTPDDEVVLEATTHCWAVVRALTPFVARVVPWADSGESAEHLTPTTHSNTTPKHVECQNGQIPVCRNFARNPRDSLQRKWNDVAMRVVKTRRLLSASRTPEFRNALGRPTSVADRSAFSPLRPGHLRNDVDSDEFGTTLLHSHRDQRGIILGRIHKQRRPSSIGIDTDDRVSLDHDSPHKKEKAIGSQDEPIAFRDP